MHQPLSSTRTRQGYDGYVFDLDGTVYLGEALLPEAEHVIRTLRGRGARIVFLTNNPTRDAGVYAEKLTSLGIPASRQDVLTTISTMTGWLIKNARGKKVFVIGEEPLKHSLAHSGITLSENPRQIGIVVASYDRAFAYRKLQIAFDAITTFGHASLVATNLDPYCPLPGGRGEPDAGAIVAAIEACTGTHCAVNTGKPSSILIRAVLDKIQLPPENCIMIGDRLTTDIKMGNDGNMDTALTLTGLTTRQSLTESPVQPTYILDHLENLLSASRRSSASEGCPDQAEPSPL